MIEKLSDPDFLRFYINLAFQAFFAILFLQSGIDKVTDWKGNLDWLTGHFEKSPLAGMVPMMLGTLTLIEVSTGIAAAAGFVGLLVEVEWIAIVAVMLATVSLLSVFFGQRMAKDYEGAAGIVPYFVAVMLAVYFLAT